MYYSLTTINAFYELIRSGLWNHVPNETFFTSLDTNQWEDIYGMVKKHAVIGITFYALEQLPENLRPSRNIYLNWYGNAAYIKNENRCMIEAYAQLVNWFVRINVSPILLKGIGIATYYPDPLLRITSDIDIYLKHDEYARVIAAIEQERFYQIGRAHV